MTTSNHENDVVGTVTSDLFIEPETMNNATTKATCAIHERLGGAPVGVSRAIAACGGRVAPHFLIGDDKLGEQVVDELGDEFRAAQFHRCLPATRRSVVIGERVYTTRPTLRSQVLPPALHQALASSELAIIGPLSATDEPFTAAALPAARTTIWMPSAQQLGDRDSAVRMMGLATVTIMNDQEASLLTGCDDPIDAICLCRDWTAGAKMIVTSRTGVLAWWGDTWLSAPALQVASPVRTIGAGDFFAGVFASTWLAGHAAEEAMQCGQMAAGRHVLGLVPLKSVKALQGWSAGQLKVSLRATKPAVPAIRWHRAAGLIAAGVAASVFILATI
ncbi:MAG: carbohydrate kinase family protein [Planctomycetota bacterium]|nr:carbohydrate kinase family protein [Planctomycetota bacterium]